MNPTNVASVVRMLLALTPEERKTAVGLSALLADAKTESLKNTKPEAPAPAENVCKVCGFVGYDVRGMHIHAGHVHKGKQLSLKGVK